MVLNVAITTAQGASGSRSISRRQPRADGPLKGPLRGPQRPLSQDEMAARTKCEPLCQFCVSWHTLSWSVPVEIAEMAETGDQTKTWIYADFIGLSREKDWCCQT